MRDVDDAHDAEDQAQADRDQEHQSGVGDAVERREDGDAEVHATLSAAFEGDGGARSAPP